MLRSKIVAGVLAVAVMLGLSWQGAASAATPERGGATVTVLLSRAGVPEQVVRELDDRDLAALRQSIKVSQAGTSDVVEAAAIWPIIREFVKRNWSRIVDAAKRAGVWVWRKAHICLGGALQEVYVYTGGNPALIAADPERALEAAVRGCIKALR